MSEVRKVVLLMGMGVDGIGAGGWLPMIEDETDGKEALEEIWGRLKSVDTFILGGVCYRQWKDYWPLRANDPASNAFQKEFSRFADRVHKVVISRTMTSVDWQNSRLVTGDIPDEIARLRKEPGKDMAIVGGPGIAGVFNELGLIDEYRLWVHPVILGQGTPLLGHPSKPQNLKVVGSKAYRSGVLSITLRPLR